jgi:hypothetical protein
MGESDLDILLLFRVQLFRLFCRQPRIFFFALVQGAIQKKIYNVNLTTQLSTFVLRVLSVSC